MIIIQWGMVAGLFVRDVIDIFHVMVYNKKIMPETVRVIIPVEYGCLDERRQANGVPWGTQAEQVVAECNGGAVGSIDGCLKIEGEPGITYLMKPLGEVKVPDDMIFGHDPDLLAAVVAFRKRTR